MNNNTTSWQMLLSLALGCTIGVATLSAHDDQPPVVVASLPDDGQPPAPSREDIAEKQEPVAQESAVADTAKPEALPPEALPSAASEAAAAAEVVTVEQVEQLADKPQDPAEVRELSIEPVLETRPMLPADRPAWVGAPNDTSERIHRLYVASFTANSAAEVEAAEMLDDPLVAAVRRYLDETLFPGEDAQDVPITPEFVRQNLLDKSTSYVAAMTTQSGVEYQKWVVLQVTPEQRDYFTQLLREHKQRHRLAVLGAGLASLLGFTGLVNMAFNRRRRRYPNTMAPLSMAAMPGNGFGNGQDNYVQMVAAGAAPGMVCKAAPKKRSCLKKTLIMMVAAGLVFAFVMPAFFIKTSQHIPHRTERTRVEVNGKVWEVKTTTPILENILSDHN